jgi:hypothetical protein
MTRNREKGDNDVTDEAKREAARTGENVCAVLKRLLRAAKQKKDRARQMKIVQAQKFLRCRNLSKRSKRS